MCATIGGIDISAVVMCCLHDPYSYPVRSLWIDTHTLLLSYRGMADMH
jgi:hypothetical protein